MPRGHARPLFSLPHLFPCACYTPEYSHCLLNSSINFFQITKVTIFFHSYSALKSKCSASCFEKSLCSNFTLWRGYISFLFAEFWNIFPSFHLFWPWWEPPVLFIQLRLWPWFYRGFSRYTIAFLCLLISLEDIGPFISKLQKLCLWIISLGSRVQSKLATL